MDLPFQDLWLPAVRNRMVLLANHVLAGCPPAVERLCAHAGKVVRVDASGWPGLIPVPPPLAVSVPTPLRAPPKVSAPPLVVDKLLPPPVRSIDPPVALP